MHQKVTIRTRNIKMCKWKNVNPDTRFTRTLSEQQQLSLIIKEPQQDMMVSTKKNRCLNPEEKVSTNVTTHKIKSVHSIGM